VVWDASEVNDSDKVGLTSGTSAKTVRRYPGGLSVTVRYLLIMKRIAAIIQAKAEKATLFNICNHSYFNCRAPTPAFSGISDPERRQYTVVNEELIRQVSCPRVEGTPDGISGKRQY